MIVPSGGGGAQTDSKINKKREKDKTFLLLFIFKLSGRLFVQPPNLLPSKASVLRCSNPPEQPTVYDYTETEDDSAKLHIYFIKKA